MNRDPKVESIVLNEEERLKQWFDDHCHSPKETN